MMKKHVVRFIITIKLLKSKLIFASLRDKIGMSGKSLSDLPTRWSRVLAQINQNFLIIY